MIKIRKAAERGHANYGWLDTHYTFSFNTYYDPQFMGFRSLRVINEDFVAPAKGFPTHGHNDMEILTYVISGAIAHKDSSGGEGFLRPNEIQRMTAGTGIEHSEYNPSDSEELHLYQIWIMPERKGLAPSYEQKSFAPEEKFAKLKLLASRDARENSANINQDASVYISSLEAGNKIEYELAKNRHAWVQVVSGVLEVNDMRLEKSDGAAISEETNLELGALENNTEFLLFDLN